MLSDAFNGMFARLVGAFTRYHDTPRRPERVVALATARWELHLARASIASERQRLLTRPTGDSIARQTAVSEGGLARLRVRGIGAVR